jgi:hypothetical protein
MTFWNNCLRLGKTSDSPVKTVQGRHRPSKCLALGLFMTVTFSAQAHAQSASFRSVDTNRDGVLSLNELIAEFGRAGAERLLRQSDRNNDNTLTIQELRQRSDDDRDTDRTTRDNDDDRDDSDDDGGDDD